MDSGDGEEEKNSRNWTQHEPSLLILIVVERQSGNSYGNIYHIVIPPHIIPSGNDHTKHKKDWARDKKGDQTHILGGKDGMSYV